MFDPVMLPYNCSIWGHFLELKATKSFLYNPFLQISMNIKMLSAAILYSSNNLTGQIIEDI